MLLKCAHKYDVIRSNKTSFSKDFGSNKKKIKNKLVTYLDCFFQQENL